MRERLDKILVDRGLVESRERARRVVMAGDVRVGERVVDKPGTLIADDAVIEVRGADMPFVSRGGLKLDAALRHFAISLADEIVLDVGASTGGFTDCALQHGARAVYAVDVGYGQLDWKLRNDPRVVLLERTNARHLGPALLPSRADVAVVDVSFISLRLVLPAVVDCLEAHGLIVALIKPQFEVGKGRVGKGGVVRDPALHAEVVEGIRSFAAGLGLEHLGVCESPILGPKGNREFLIGLRIRARPAA